MIQASEEMVDWWETGQTIDICHAMMDLTMGITTQAFFGVDLRGKAEGKVLVRFTELFNQRLITNAHAIALCLRIDYG